MWSAADEMGGKHMGEGVEAVDGVDGRVVNHSRVGPLRVVGKALQKTVSWDVYRVTWVM